MDWSKELVASEVGFTTDAAVGPALGFGCIFNKAWSYAQWEPGFIKDKEPSIEFLELYALCVGILTWGEQSFKNKRIVVLCNNEAVVHMINNTASACPFCMTLIQKLTLHNLKWNTRVFARWLAGSKNILPDRLSRMRIKEFKKLTENQGFDRTPTLPSMELWPLSTYWDNNCKAFEKGN